MFFLVTLLSAMSLSAQTLPYYDYSEYYGTPSYPSYEPVNRHVTISLKADRECLRQIRGQGSKPRQKVMDAIEICNWRKWSDYNHFYDQGYRCRGGMRVDRRPSKQMVAHLVAQAGGQAQLKAGDLDVIRSADTDLTVECYR